MTYFQPGNVFLERQKYMTLEYWPCLWSYALEVPKHWYFPEYPSNSLSVLFILWNAYSQAVGYKTLINLKYV